MKSSHPGAAVRLRSGAGLSKRSTADQRRNSPPDARTAAVAPAPYELEQSRDLKTQKKEPTVKYYTRRALRTTTGMVGLPFGLALLHRERRSLVRTAGACFLALLYVAFAAFPCFGQQSPDPKAQVASSSTPTDGTSSPATPAASPAQAAPAAPAPLPCRRCQGLWQRRILMRARENWRLQVF